MKLSKRARLFAGVSGAVVLCATTGCSGLNSSPFIPTDRQEAGTYVHGGTSATVQIESSGSIIFTNVPEVLLDRKLNGSNPHHGNWGSRVTATGTFTPAYNDGTGTPEIDGTYGSSKPFQLWLRGTSASTLSVVIYYGSDAQFEYDFSRSKSG